MEFTATEDIDAPLEQVFAEISNLDRIERSLLKQGVELQRSDGTSGNAPGEGATWNAVFTLSGKSRDATVTMTRYDPPQMMTFQTVLDGFTAQIRVDLVALSRSDTRVTLLVALQPKTLSARLLVQSMKLARGKIDTKFQGHAAQYAKELEDRLKRSA